nr:MAG TPA: hypothetical protein [Caudoviricetes sp.]
MIKARGAGRGCRKAAKPSGCFTSKQHRQTTVSLDIRAGVFYIYGG